MNREKKGPSGFRRKLYDLFGIDPRTLAISRVAVSSVLIYNLVSRASELRTMYSDGGIFPIDDVRQFWGPDSWRWSFHMLSGSTSYQAILFALAIFFAVLLAVGLLTRLSTVVSWLLLISLHTRAPVLVTGGDILLAMLLFWGMFLPWGKRSSLDAWLSGVGGDTTPVLSVASAAILLQVAFMYFFTAFSKCNYLWFEGRALESVFLNPLVSRPLGTWFVQFPAVLEVLTHATLVLELVGPLLMFSPWKTITIRTWAVSCFALLHVGIELTMHVVIFSYASLAALTLFTPARFWNNPQLRQFTGRWQRLERESTSLSPDMPATSSSPLRRAAGIAVSSFCLAALGYVLIVNPLAYFGSPRTYSRLPTALRRVDDLAGLGQRWSMFACPATSNYRYVAVANLRNGSQVDILRDREFVGDERPEQLTLDLPSQRWVQIMIDLTRGNRHMFRQSLTRYLARQWNAQHPPNEQIEHVQLAILYEQPSATGAPSQIESAVLARFDPLACGTYRNGERDGEWSFYYPSGQPEASGVYRDGKEHGRWTLFYEDGRVQGTGTYVDGKMHGRWTFWYADGEKAEVDYEAGHVRWQPLPGSEDLTAHDQRPEEEEEYEEE